MHSPPKNSAESELLEILRNPKDWCPTEGEGEEDEHTSDGKNSVKSI